MDESKNLTVRKLRRILNDLPPDLPIVLEGTEYDLPARSAQVEDWRETDAAGTPRGDAQRVVIIKL